MHRCIVRRIANLTKRILHGFAELQNFSSTGFASATKINNHVLPARSHFMDQWSTVRWLVLRILILTGIPFSNKLLKNIQCIFYFSSLFQFNFISSPVFFFFSCFKRYLTWCYVRCQSWLVKLHKRVTEGLPSSRFIFSINTRWKEVWKWELSSAKRDVLKFCGERDIHSFTRSVARLFTRSFT